MGETLHRDKRVGVGHCAREGANECSRKVACCISVGIQKSLLYELSKGSGVIFVVASSKDPNPVV